MSRSPASSSRTTTWELYVNGKFVARDGLGFFPFNSSAVRFKAKYPMTYAIEAIDWESHLGLGMEREQYNVGDGGLIARFSDGTITDARWKAETFYIAPLGDPACVKTAGGRDSTGCPVVKHERFFSAPCAKVDPKDCKALHFPVPEGWTARNFDDSTWPSATLWKAEEVTGAPAYVKYTELFTPARFIWSRNLVLDNLVLARFTARGPAR